MSVQVRASFTLPLQLYGRSGMVIPRSARPTAEELEMIQDGTILMGFLHLPDGSLDKIDTILTKKITAIAYELIQVDDGPRPVEAALSLWEAACRRRSPRP